MKRLLPVASTLLLSPLPVQAQPAEIKSPRGLLKRNAEAAIKKIEEASKKK
jgi:hypothetical protein